MPNLKYYLEKSFKDFLNWRKFDEIHLVLGNESCDLDSTISAISYGYLLHDRFKNDEKITVFPILNVSFDNFKLRTEHCSILKDSNVDLERLIYRDQVKFEDFQEKCVQTYLVDHHVLAQNDRILQATVCKILDHRPRDDAVKWSDSVDVRIELVGSCATLVTDEFFKNNEEILFEKLAYLLYCTIIFDTLAALPENKKAKPLDIKTVERLEEKFGFDKNGRLNLFRKLVELHSDVSHLTPKQLLVRDLKFVDNIPVPALPMLVETFVELPETLKSLNEMCTENESDFIVLVGIEAKPNVKRDVGLFFKNDTKLRENLIREFKSKSDFQFVEIEKDGVVVLRQSNIEYTRKQIMPIVRKFVNNDGANS